MKMTEPSSCTHRGSFTRLQNSELQTANLLWVPTTKPRSCCNLSNHCLRQPDLVYNYLDQQITPCSCNTDYSVAGHLLHKVCVIQIRIWHVVRFHTCIEKSMCLVWQETNAIDNIPITLMQSILVFSTQPILLILQICLLYKSYVWQISKRDQK